MKECTETDKPLVSIVMATYNPRMDWLKEQLVSLNDQSYDCLELLVLDDCSSKVSLEEITACVEECITEFPFRIMQNQQNLGSTRTFEKLTLLANGEYLAYCDQDDVWHGDKIPCYMAEFQNSNGLTVMVFSDMNIIDADGRMVVDSITKIRRHHKFQGGTGLSKGLLFKNFVTGCAMMVKAESAKRAIPFCPHMVHDHWLALFCSIEGELKFINKPYVNYRVHDKNQTLLLAGVTGKISYVKIRIEEPLKKFYWLRDRLQSNQGLSIVIVQAIEWMTARKDYFEGRGSAASLIWKYRNFSKLVSLFEIVAAFMPETLFGFFINLAKRNII